MTQQEKDSHGRTIDEVIAAVSPDIFYDDGYGLWYILKQAEDFGLEGAARIDFVRRYLHALLRCGGMPVRWGQVDGYWRWVADTKYGADPDAIVEGTIADWLAQGLGDLEYRSKFWFCNQKNLDFQAIPTSWDERRRAWQPGEDPNEPRHRTCDAPMSRWIALTAQEDPLINGLSRIVFDGIDGFGLSGAALDNFVRRSVGVLVDAGWRLTALDYREGGGGRRVVDPRHGEDRWKIVEAVMAEWRRRGKGRLNADVQVLTPPGDIGTIPWYARR